MAWSSTLIKYHDNVKELLHAYSFYVTWQGSYFDKATLLKGLLHSDRLLDDLSKAAQNETLGFEKIFYISMPHRQDRQDSMTILQMRERTAREGELRSHDANAPYGLDWDLLYVGTCWNINPEDIVRPLSNHIKPTGHIQILRGSLAPGGSVGKITGKEGLRSEGKARVFDSEPDMIAALERIEIKKGEMTVVIIRYDGPKGRPGMPEMLKPSSAIMGAGLGQDVALLADGRYSGGSHGFIISHIVPEALDGGPIALVHDSDHIVIDAEKRVIDLAVAKDEMAARRKAWKPPPPRYTRGTLTKYARLITDTSSGYVTDKAQ
ncbi:hypothetical protein NHJ13051_009671 [Beauveria bassiana]